VRLLSHVLSAGLGCKTWRWSARLVLSVTQVRQVSALRACTLAGIGVACRRNPLGWFSSPSICTKRGGLVMLQLGGMLSGMSGLSRVIAHPGGPRWMRSSLLNGVLVRYGEVYHAPCPLSLVILRGGATSILTTCHHRPSLLFSFLLKTSDPGCCTGLLRPAVWTRRLLSGLWGRVADLWGGPDAIVKRFRMLSPPYCFRCSSLRTCRLSSTLSLSMVFVIVAHCVAMSRVRVCSLRGRLAIVRSK